MTVPISPLQLLLAALLMLVSVVLSWRLRLGLGREIVMASVRMTVQLLLVGLILSWVFALRHPLPVIGIGLIMTVLAGQAAVSRSSRRYPRVYLDSFLAVFGSSFLLTGIALSGILQVRPWFEAQYAVPILGMVLGNTLTGSGNLIASRPNLPSGGLKFRRPHQRHVARPGGPAIDAFFD